jgi:hypothetical protein
MALQLSDVYLPSEDVVARTIEGELIIVPLTADFDNEAIFTLNATAQAIWKRMDGKHTVKEVIDDLAGEYTGTDRKVLTEDVQGLIRELYTRKMLIQL